jgi:hypothetical protein
VIRRRPGIGWCILLGVAAGCPASAAEFNLKVKADGIELGKSIMGPRLAKEDLKGHVVMLEFWGIS